MQSKTTRAFRTISEAAEELDLQPHVLRFWESKFPSFKPIKRGGGRRFYRPEDIEFLRGIKILLHDERHPIKDVQKLIRVKGSARVTELGRSIKKAAIKKDVKDTVLVPEYVRGTPTRTNIDVTEDNQTDEFEGESFFPQDAIADESQGDDQSVPDKDINEDLSEEATSEDTADIEETVAAIVDGSSEPEPAPEAVADVVEPIIEQPVEELEAIAVPEEEPVRGKGLLGSIHSIEAMPSGLSETERNELELALARLQDLRRQWQSFKQDTPPQLS